MKVRFTRQANIQLGVILDYVRERNPRSADQLAVRIHRTCAQIAENPKLGRKQGVEGVRRKIVQPGSYLVYYSVNAEERIIVILGISHPAQQRLYNDV